MEPEDQLGYLPAVEGDLPLSRPAIPPSSLPPSPSSLSSDQAPFRSDGRDTVQVLMLSPVAPGTTRTYEAVLQPMAPKIADKPESALLQTVSEDAFFAFPGAFLLLAPESVSPVTGQSVVRRNYVKIVKAAAAVWCVARGSRAKFDRYWPPAKWGQAGAASSVRAAAPRMRRPLSSRRR